MGKADAPWELESGREGIPTLFPSTSSSAGILSSLGGTALSSPDLDSQLVLGAPRPLPRPGAQLLHSLQGAQV